jgi:hypothetical protein
MQIQVRVNLRRSTYGDKLGHNLCLHSQLPPRERRALRVHFVRAGQRALFLRTLRVPQAILNLPQSVVCKE